MHREAGYDFYFYAEEGNEPPHVHADRGGGTAKFWLDPVRLARAEGLKVKEIKQIAKIVEDIQTHLLKEWHEFFERKD